MRFDWTTAFAGDWHRLPEAIGPCFVPSSPPTSIQPANACRTDPRGPFPKKLRVKPVVGARGIWEMTWSFAGPDGRATFEWVEIDGEPAVRWRRIGGHAILGSP